MTSFRRWEKYDHAAMLAVARHRHPAFTFFLRGLTVTGMGAAWAVGILFLKISAYFDLFPFPNREFITRAMLAPGFAWLIVKSMKIRWRRRRPFQVISGYERLARAPMDDSFPSGHTASVFAFWIAVLPLGNPVASAVGVWALLVAYSRYYLGVHFPSDILVGGAIGMLAGGGFNFAIARFFY